MVDKIIEKFKSGLIPKNEFLVELVDLIYNEGEIDWESLSEYHIDLCKITRGYGRWKHCICLICGNIIKYNELSTHIKSHNLTELEYSLRYNNLVELPKCSNPNCDNRVRLVTKGANAFLNITKYCSQKCCMTHNQRLGASIGGKVGGPIGGYHAAYWSRTQSLLGKHRWQHKNLKLDERGKSINHTKGNLTKIRQGNCNSQLNSGFGVKVKVIFPDKVFNLRSLAEFYFFLYKIIIDKVDYHKIDYEIPIKLGLTYSLSDFIIDNINYEIHSDGSECDKLESFNALNNLGIKSIFVPISLCYYKYAEELSKVIDINTITKEVKLSNKFIINDADHIINMYSTTIP